MIVGPLEVLEKFRVVGWVGVWVVSSIIVSLQSSLELELGVRSLDFEFGVGLEFDWTFA